MLTGICSYGMVLWELVGRSLPFGEEKWDNVVEEKVKSGERPAMPAGTREDYAALVRLCWAQEPSKRPSFAQIILKLMPIVRMFNPNA